MEKVFLIGDNESLLTEISGMLKSGYEIMDQLDDTAEIIFELSGSGKDFKSKFINFIDEKNSKATVISSSLCMSVLEQSVNSKYPERITGAALYPTVSLAKGIEITGSRYTSREHLSLSRDLFEKAGKEVTEVKDRPGMIGMRIISLIINEAYLVLQEGTSVREDIDTAMKLGTNYPFGPIEWSEKIGVDIIYNILTAMSEEFGEDRYRITPLLREKYLETFRV
ncbi:MAG: hypothetical protein JSS91_05505 [Bacteroidetes bacterium]|nr:hypothetical protein [Bacteroidota bacterium]